MNEAASRAAFDEEVAALRAFGANGLPGFPLPVLEVTCPRVVVGIKHPGHPDLALRIESVRWNEQPASYLFVEPTDYSLVLPAPKWPGQPFPRLPQQGFLGRHFGPFRDDHVHWKAAAGRQRKPVVEGPMICMKGTREYHLDHRHHHDAWVSYRADPNYSFASMAYKIQERVYEVAGARFLVRPAT